VLAECDICGHWRSTRVTDDLGFPVVGTIAIS
jgi:hypothetical protein